MKRKLLKMLAILIILLGLALIVVPQLLIAYNDTQNDSKIEVYEKTLKESISEDAANDVLTAANDYNNRLFLGENTTLHEYHNLLMEDKCGMMGYVNIPSLRLLVPIFHDGQEGLDQGAIHVLGSSLPVGGENTHSVIAAHTGNQNGRFFTDLTELAEDDCFIVNVLGKSLYYKVFRIKTVLPEDTRLLKIKKGKDYCTLLTCTPYGINSHRLLVTGRRMLVSDSVTLENSNSGKLGHIPESVEESSSSQHLTTGFTSKFLRHFDCELAGTALLIAMLIAYVLWQRRKKILPDAETNNIGDTHENKNT